MEVFELVWFYFTMMMLGLSMAAPPGPINAMITLASLQSNLKGTAIGAGAMTADLIFYFIIFLIKGLIPSELIKFLYGIGGLYTAFLGLLAIKSKMIFKIKTGGSYLMGLIMGITNPYQIAWWISFGIVMLDRFGILSGIGFFSGIALWIFTYPYSIKKAGKISMKVEKLIKMISALVLICIGLYMIMLFIISF